MSLFLGFVCVAIAISTVCWLFLGSYGFAKFFKYFLWAALALGLVVIAFQVTTYMGLNIAQVSTLGTFVLVFLFSLFFGDKDETDKPKRTDCTSTKNSPPRSRRDRDTGRYL